MQWQSKFTTNFADLSYPFYWNSSASAFIMGILDANQTCHRSMWISRSFVSEIMKWINLVQFVGDLAVPEGLAEVVDGKGPVGLVDQGAVMHTGNLKKVQKVGKPELAFG